MTVQLQHQIWSEDQKPVFAPRMIEKPGFLPAGSIELRYFRDPSTAASEYAHVITGNDADDFLERYRAAPDEEARQLVMAAEIRRGL